jgi:hypothetical protein
MLNNCALSLACAIMQASKRDINLYIQFNLITPRLLAQQVIIINVPKLAQQAQLVNVDSTTIFLYMVSN